MPDNAFYMHAAYVAATAIYGVYALSVWRRRRQLERRRAGALGAAAPPASGSAEGHADAGARR